MKNKTLSISLDLSSLTLSFLLSFLIRQSSFLAKYFGYLNYDPREYTVAFIASTILLLVTFSAFKLYQIREIELSARIFTVIKALAVWAFITASLMYITKSDFSRGIFFMTVGLSFVSICTSRYLLFLYRQKKVKDKDIEITIIGTGNRANELEKQIKDAYRFASCNKLDIKNPNNHHLLKNKNPSEIFMADESLPRDEVLSIIAEESFDHHSFRVILDTFRLATGEIRLNDIDEVPSILPRNEPNSGYKIIKRAIDIAASAFGLIILSPLWLIATILIKIDSEGPVHISQTRIGWNKKPFTIFKLRTMYINTSLYDLAPRHEDDYRITKVGKILRRFSLDEMPQLWNILKGDMSLVGPRPEMEFIVNRYAPWQNFRLKAKPGLTGLWQILGRKDLPLHENLEYDFYYVTNRSLLLDFSIILKTVPAVLFGRGAY